MEVKNWGHHEAYCRTFREEKILPNIKHHVLLPSICDMEQKLHGHQAAKRKIFTHEVDRKIVSMKISFQASNLVFAFAFVFEFGWKIFHSNVSNLFVCRWLFNFYGDIHNVK